MPRMRGGGNIACETMKHRTTTTVSFLCFMLAACTATPPTVEAPASDYIAGIKARLAAPQSHVFVFPLGVRQHADDPDYIIVDLAIVGDAADAKRLAGSLHAVMFSRPEEFLEIRDASMRPIRIDKDKLLRRKDWQLASIQMSDEEFYTEPLDGERKILIEPFAAALNPTRRLHGVTHVRLNSNAITELYDDLGGKSGPVTVDDRWLETTVANVELVPN